MAHNQLPVVVGQALGHQPQEAQLILVAQEQQAKGIVAATIILLRHTLLEAAAARVRLAEQVQVRSLALVAQDRRLQ